MQIFLTGPNREKFIFSLESSDKLADLKSKLLEKCGDKVKDTRLTFKGKFLPDKDVHITLEELGIKHNSSLHFIPRLHGGQIYEYCD